MAQEFRPPFQPQHEDAGLILSRIVNNLPSQVFDALYHSMYNAGGFAPSDYEKIHERAGHCAARLLSELRGEKVEYSPLPF